VVTVTTTSTMPPPISDLLRSRGGVNRNSNHHSNGSTSSHNDSHRVVAASSTNLPLHYQNGKSSSSSSPSTTATATATSSSSMSSAAIGNHNFLFGGMYVPNKEKKRYRRQRPRNAMIPFSIATWWNGNQRRLWCRVSVLVLVALVTMLFTFLGRVKHGPQSQLQLQLQSQQRQHSLPYHLFSRDTQYKNIDRLLQDTSLRHRLPSMRTQQQHITIRIHDRIAYQQQQSTILQQRMQLLEYIVPQWYHRNDPPSIPVPVVVGTEEQSTKASTTTTTVKDTETTTDRTIRTDTNHVDTSVRVMVDTKHHSINHVIDTDSNTSWEHVTHIHPTSPRVRHTLQNNNNYRHPQQQQQQSLNITALMTSSCPHILSKTNISVTLLLQSSIDRVWIIDETCQRWTSPIIVVVAIHDPLENTNKSSLQDQILRWKTTCAHVTVILYHLDNTTESTPDTYPVNTLRNVALDAVQTSHILMMDVDFVPAHALDQMIQTTLRNEQHLTVTTKEEGENDEDLAAMVIPAFDRVLHPPCTTAVDCAQHLQHDSNFIPYNFSDLIRCYTTDQCIVFQSLDNWEGHSSTRTELWLQQQQRHNIDTDRNPNNNKSVDDTTKPKIASSIPCFDSLRYEPYVVLRWCPTSVSSTPNTTVIPIRPVAPYYDERFHGYGKNKIQLISHLRLMGYRFTILPQGGFIVHNPHVESSAKQTWNDVQHHTLHRTMDVLSQDFLNELVQLYLTGTDKGGTSPQNIVTACPTKS
jgi:Glycosyl-transferase for dystroglycan